jgi:glycosyltransferase involved in cell wall biosynthesis
MKLEKTANPERNPAGKPAILVVTELYPNVTNPFLGTFVVQQLRHLSGHYTIVVLTTHSMRSLRRLRLVQPGYQEDGGIHVYSVPYFPFYLNFIRTRRLISHETHMWWNKRHTGKKLWTMAEQLHRRYDFKLVYGQEVYVGDEAVPIGIRLGIPKIFLLHGLHPYHEKLFGPPAVASALRNMEEADRLISVSRVAADSYREKGLRRNDFSFIPNGASPRPAAEPSPFLREFTRGKTVLLTAGFFSPEKRIHQSIHALRDLHASGEKDTVLVIVGAGGLRGELESLVGRLGLEQHVHFTGVVDPADMPAIYAAADILVHPSVVESFSMVCLEAMSYGKPVVCTNGIGILEFIHPGVDSISVPPDRQELLSGAVARLVGNPEERRRIGEAARRTALSMTWEIQAEKTRKIFESV